MKNKVTFVIFLAALLIFPVSFPFLKSRVDTTSYEKRTLAQAPEFSSIKEIGDYLTMLEGWFNDRLPYKNQLVAANAKFRTALGLDQTILDFLAGGQVIRGKENWLFFNATDHEDSLGDFLCTNLYTEEEMAEIAAGYQALHDRYQEEGIEFILFFAPNKEQVYPEFMPDTLVPKGPISRTDQLTAYLREHTDVTALYAKAALIAEKENGFQVYYKYDTHWNELGGFVGEQLIKGALTGESKTLSEVTVEAVDEAPLNDLAGVIGLGGTLKEAQDWIVADYEPDVTVTITSEGSDPAGEYISFSSDARDPRSVLVVKDSFSINMMPYFARDFAETMFIIDSARSKEYVREQHPDVVVLEIAERQYYRMEGQWKELLDE